MLLEDKRVAKGQVKERQGRLAHGSLVNIAQVQEELGKEGEVVGVKRRDSLGGLPKGLQSELIKLSEVIVRGPLESGPCAIDQVLGEVGPEPWDTLHKLKQLLGLLSALLLEERVPMVFGQVRCRHVVVVHELAELLERLFLTNEGY